MKLLIFPFQDVIDGGVSYWHARFALAKVNGAPKNGVGGRASERATKEPKKKKFTSSLYSSNSPMNDDGFEGLKSEGGATAPAPEESNELASYYYVPKSIVE